MAALAVAVPYFALRASGYRVDTTRWRIVPTGAIAVNAIPVGATVTVRDADGETVGSERTTAFAQTAFFPDLLPGAYTVEAAASDRQRWTKTAHVAERQTASFAFVRLFPETVTPQPAFSRPVRELRVHPDNTYLIGWDSTGLLGVRLRDGEALPALEQLVRGSIADASWVGSLRLLLRFTSGAVALVDLTDSGAPRLLPITGGMQDVLPFDEDSFLALNEQGALLRYVLTPQSGTLELSAVEIIAQDIAAIASHGRAFSYLDTRGTAWTHEPDVATPVQRNVVPLELPEGTPRMVASRHGTAFLLIDGAGTAWLLARDADRFVTIADGIRDAEFSFDDRKVLLTGAREVTMYMLEDRPEQPSRSKGDRETITRLHEQVLKAGFLAPEEEHVLIQSEHALHLLELDPRGGRNNLRYDNITASAMHATPAQLLLTDTQGGLAIIPIPIPGFLSQILL
jgi:hypothetical protein